MTSSALTETASASRTGERKVLHLHRRRPIDLHVDVALLPFPFLLLLLCVAALRRHRRRSTTSDELRQSPDVNLVHRRLDRSVHANWIAAATRRRIRPHLSDMSLLRRRWLRRRQPPRAIIIVNTMTGRRITTMSHHRPHRRQRRT